MAGRVKHQIDRGGEKIASEEVEHLPMRHPGAAQAALVALPGASPGKKSCAFVVARTAPRGIDLRRPLTGPGVADHKLPDRLRFVETLPLTAVGKTDKRLLRARPDLFGTDTGEDMSLIDNAALQDDWLAAQVARMTDEDGIGPDDDLTLRGLDSMGVMRLALLLEERGIVLSFDDLIARPTLNAWRALIARHRA